MSPAATRQELPPLRLMPGALPAAADEGAHNIGFEAVDRHVLRGHGEDVALRWLPRQGAPRELTYDDLRRETNRFANVLRDGLGVGKGDRLFILCEGTPDFYVGLLGALKAGLMVCPLPPSLDAEAVRQRLEVGRPHVVLTTRALFEQEVEDSVPRIASLHHILVTGEPLRRLMREAPDEFDADFGSPSDASFLHFTEDAHGAPTAVLHVSGETIMRHAMGRLALDLDRDDVFWCGVEPRTMPDIGYGILAPLLEGATCIVDEQPFSAERFYAVLESQDVSVWHASREALETLVAAGDGPWAAHHFPRLRLVAVTGAPVDSHLAWWALDVLGVPIHQDAEP
ncbi:MAG TPA: AMP-binding protein [Usitatibacter sp.]|nr:AMP-binding protein [Usitatibacter sp.]